MPTPSKFQKNKPQPPDEPMQRVTLRLPASTIARYQEMAVPPLTRSDLYRAAIERNLHRLPQPRIVPAVNRESLMELWDVMRDLHDLSRALHASRTAAFDAAAENASKSTLALLDWLRLAPENSQGIRMALADARRDARALHTVAVSLRRGRPEELNVETVRSVGAKVDRLAGVLSAFMRQMFGAREEVS